MLLCCLPGQRLITSGGALQGVPLISCASSSALQVGTSSALQRVKPGHHLNGFVGPAAAAAAGDAAGRRPASETGGLAASQRHHHPPTGTSLGRPSMPPQQQLSGPPTPEEDVVRQLVQLLPKLISSSRAGDSAAVSKYNCSRMEALASAPAAARISPQQGLLEPQRMLGPEDAADGAGSVRTLTEMVALAAASALDQPALASDLLHQALQEQLRRQSLECQQAAANAASALTTVGDQVRRG